MRAVDEGALLDQLGEILGELKIGRAGFSRLLEEGMLGASILGDED